MLWSILVLFCALILVAQTVGTREFGRDAFAPIALLGAAALIGLGSLSSGWIMERGFATFSDAPARDQQSALLAVAGILKDAQGVGLVVVVTALLMVASTAFAGRRVGEPPRGPQGRDRYWMLVFLAGPAVAAALALMAIDAFTVRAFIAALRPRSPGDSVHSISSLSTMVLTLLFGGLVLASGAGFSAGAGMFLVEREGVHRGQAVVTYVLLSVLGVCALIAAVGHVASIRELRILR